MKSLYEVVRKGRALPIGTVRKRKDGEYKKTAQGWVPVKSGKKATAKKKKLSKNKAGDMIAHQYKRMDELEGLRLTRMSSGKRDRILALPEIVVTSAAQAAGMRVGKQRIAALNAFADKHGLDPSDPQAVAVQVDRLVAKPLQAARKATREQNKRLRARNVASDQQNIDWWASFKKQAQKEKSKAGVAIADKALGLARKMQGISRTIGTSAYDDRAMDRQYDMDDKLDALAKKIDEDPTKYLSREAHIKMLESEVGRNPLGLGKIVSFDDAGGSMRIVD